MDAKTYLQQVRKLDKLIKNKLIETQQWEELALSVTARLGGERVQSSGSNSKMADAMNRCMDAENECAESVIKFTDKKREILGVIEQLDPTCYDLLHLHYVQFMTLDEAAMEMDKSYTWATTTHRTALNKVQAIIDKMGE